MMMPILSIIWKYGRSTTCHMHITKRTPTRTYKAVTMLNLSQNHKHTKEASIVSKNKGRYILVFAYLTSKSTLKFLIAPTKGFKTFRLKLKL